MKLYKFTVARHEEYGMMGLKPVWYPNGDPLTGMAAAHDILEHFPKDNGNAEGEWQALGASLWIRGNAGYYQNGTPESNIASDLPEVWSIQPYARACGLSRDLEIMEQARSAVAHWMDEERTRDNDSLPSSADQENVARWIARGYQRAKRRYRASDCHSICYNLFQPIQEACDRELKHADEGMELTVRVDFKNLEASVTCDYPTEERY